LDFNYGEAPAGIDGPGCCRTQARPRYRDNPAPAYPNLARCRGLEGTVVLEMWVRVPVAFVLK